MQMLQARTGGPALHHCYAPATPVDQITYLPACRPALPRDGTPGTQVRYLPM